MIVKWALGILTDKSNGKTNERSVVLMSAPSEGNHLREEEVK